MYKALAVALTFGLGANLILDRLAKSVETKEKEARSSDSNNFDLDSFSSSYETLENEHSSNYVHDSYEFSERITDELELHSSQIYKTINELEDIERDAKLHLFELNTAIGSKVDIQELRSSEEKGQQRIDEVQSALLVRLATETSKTAVQVSQNLKKSRENQLQIEKDSACCATESNINDLIHRYKVGSDNHLMMCYAAQLYNFLRVVDELPLDRHLDNVRYNEILNQRLERLRTTSGRPRRETQVYSLKQGNFDRISLYRMIKPTGERRISRTGHLEGFWVESTRRSSKYYLDRDSYRAKLITAYQSFNSNEIKARKATLPGYQQVSLSLFRQQEEIVRLGLLGHVNGLSIHRPNTHSVPFLYGGLDIDQNKTVKGSTFSVWADNSTTSIIRLHHITPYIDPNLYIPANARSDYEKREWHLTRIRTSGNEPTVQDSIGWFRDSAVWWNTGGQRIAYNRDAITETSVYYAPFYESSTSSIVIAHPAYKYRPSSPYNRVNEFYRESKFFNIISRDIFQYNHPITRKIYDRYPIEFNATDLRMANYGDNTLLHSVNGDCAFLLVAASRPFGGGLINSYIHGFLQMKEGHLIKTRFPMVGYYTLKGAMRNSYIAVFRLDVSSLGVVERTHVDISSMQGGERIAAVCYFV